MSVTSLKLSEQLRKRIAALVSGTETSMHAFMVRAISIETERAELRARFESAAAEAEKEAVTTGRAYRANEVFAYIRNRAMGKKAKRPRAKSWR